MLYPVTKENILLIPFFVVDGRLDWSFRVGMQDDTVKAVYEKSHYAINIERLGRSTGSAQYSMFIRLKESKKRKLVFVLDIWAIAERVTGIAISAEEGEQEASISFFNGIISMFDLDKYDPNRAIEDMRWKVILESLGSIKQSAPPAPEIKEARQPQKGDTVDVWLDWRDRERKAGRQHTLKEIAEAGGFTEIRVKRASAERKPRGQKE